MVSEPQSQGKENQQEEVAAAAATAAAAAAAAARTAAAAATAFAAAARRVAERARAPESCDLLARLGAWFCPWGSGASWRGLKLHCHPVTPSCALKRRRHSNPRRNMDAARILRRDPSPTLHLLMEIEGRRRVGLWTSGEDMVSMFFYFVTFPILILPASNDKGSDSWGFFVQAPCQDRFQAPSFRLLLPQHRLHFCLELRRE